MKVTEIKYKNLLTMVIPVAIGFAFHWFIFGFDIVNPLNISWLNRDDTLQAYLGWEFFRNSPWSFPVIGLSPDYGMELSGSIVYTDSNPLMAIIFKIISPLLPAEFQYFGIWILICCILSSVALWKIFSLYTKSAAIISFSTALVLFTPSWIFRIGHINLMSHFLILFSIYLALKRNNKNECAKWCLLIVASCFIHFYIAMMVIIIWGSSVIARLIKRQNDRVNIAYEVALVFLSLGISLYVAGYFAVKSVSAGGYGAFNNNLLSPLMASGWSYLINIPHIGTTGFEGFNYWGLGFIFIFTVSIPLFFKLARSESPGERFITFSLSAIAFILISTTNHVQIGGLDFTIPMPSGLLDKLSIFRASSRFFWPITYFSIISSIILTIKYRSRFVASIIVVLSFTAQAIDTHNGYNRETFYFFNQPMFQSKMTGKGWDSIIKDNPKIRYYPFINQGEHWKDISLIAHKMNARTDAIYMARVDDKKAEALNNETLDKLSSGSYDNNTTYIIGDRYIGIVKLKEGDSLFKLDGLNVLAHGLKGCRDCIRIDNSNSERYILTEGWFGFDGNGSWSNGSKASAKMLINNDSKFIKLTFSSFVTQSHPYQRVIVSINNKKIYEFESRSSSLEEKDIEIPSYVERGLVDITFDFPDAISPKLAGAGIDTRVFSIHLNSISVE